MFLSTSAASALVMVSLAWATGAAQGLHPQFGVGVGMSVPVSDYHAAPSGQGFNTAWQGLAFVALKPPSLPVGLRVDATYGANSANDRLKSDLTTALGRPSDEKTKLLGASLSVWYQSSSLARVKPYVIGGIGLYHTTISVSSGGSTTDNTATKLAWNLGAGLDCGLRGIALFFEARYVNIAAVSGFPRTTFLPITAGVRFGGR
jgi:opacity protein-like surface antigen